MRLRYPFLLALVVALLAPMASAQASLSGIVINEILADPNGGAGPDFDTDGDGSSETNDEFVEFYNTTGADVDVSGWEVYQLSGGNAVLTHTFAASTSVPANGYLVLVGGWDPGPVPAGYVTPDLGFLGLSNGGDEVYLHDPTAGSYISAHYNDPATAVTIGTSTSAGADDFGSDEDSKSIQRAPDGAAALSVGGPTPNAANILPSETFAGYLLGANEVPAVVTGAAGAVTAVLTGDQLAVTGRFAGLESDYTASHLHLAPAGGNGGVIVALAPTLGADSRSGTFDETVTLDAAQVNALRAAEIYANVHTTGNPGGELRAQLLAAPDAPDVTIQQARYIGPGYSVAVSGTVSRAMGDFTYIQDATAGLAIRQTFGAFRDEVVAGTITGGSTLDVTGELSEFASLLQISNTDLASYAVTGSTDIPDAQNVDLADLLADGEAYESELVTVSEVAFTDMGTLAAGTSYTVNDGTADGEVRVDGDEETAAVGVEIPAGPAQVTGVVSQRDFDAPFTDAYRILPILAGDVAPGEEEFAGYLRGSNEVPAVTTGAAGAVAVQLIGTELEVVGRFGGLEGAYSASHLHLAPAGENGDVIVALSPTINPDERSGEFDEMVTLTAEQAAALRMGNVYVNVHSAATPSGELRAQLEDAPDAEAFTMRQARYIGEGFPVIVSGTVSRAMGAFTYFQDATGGLVVRQTSGAFFDDVATGAITTGTTLEVEGDLSEFRALLQINNDDLEVYSITGSTAAPTPLEVTLADIAANGEEYESELVTVRAITFADAGGTFAAGTNYDVDDGTGGAVQVRVVGANDTDVDGLAIPPGNSNITGVLGQFDRDAPFIDGYQVQPILATDVQVATANEDGVLRTGAMLAVENPARGAVSVRFDAGTSGRATLTVFDMVGRQVAVLASGDVAAGERTATLDAGALASGVYVVRLDVESGTLTRVVTVVR